MNNEQNTEQKNLIIAVVVSVAILFGWHFFIEAPRIEQARQEAERRAAAEPAEQPAAPGASTAGESMQPGPAGSDPDIPRPGAGAGAPSDIPQVRPGEVLPREAALGASPRVPVESDRLTGSMALRGGRIDDLTLRGYYETVERETPVTLLNPSGSAAPWYAEFGWTAAEAGIAVPGRDTLWQGELDLLTPDQPVIKRWDNGQGLIFERTVRLDEGYMFTVEQRVINETGAPVTLYPFALVSRHREPETLNFFILHEGPIGFLGGELVEKSYRNVAEQDGPESLTSTGGWLGITDKYWLVAVVPQQDEQVTARFLHRVVDGVPRWQADWLGQAVVVPAGGEAAHESRLFAGAKEVDLLDGYEETLGIPRFDLAVDFGMFYFMTKPFFYALDTLATWTGNFGIAILLFTIVLRLLVFPLAQKSYKSFARMKEVQPQMLEIREKYKDDPKKMQEAMMDLYSREKITPVSGCLPILLQIPIFFALYKVLFVTIEMRHTPFFGWIDDLSAPDPTSLFNLFGLLPYDVPGFLEIGLWPCIMGLTMYLQTKLNPPAANDFQQSIMLVLPVVFTIMLAQFPAGLVIYWTWSNMLAIAQQYLILKRMKVGDSAAKG